MAYEVLVDGATILKSHAESKDPATGVVSYDHTATVYPKGAVLADEDVSPLLVRLLDEGDEHVASLLKKTGDKPTKEEGGEVGIEEIVTGPESGSPGRVMVDAAADNFDVLHADDDPDAAEKEREEAQKAAEEVEKQKTPAKPAPEPQTTEEPAPVAPAGTTTPARKG